MMLGSGSSVVVVLKFGWWDVAKLAAQPALVEPVDVGECGELNVFGVAPGALSADDFGLVEPVH